MLNHISQKLEVVDVADEIHAVHLREADKYVLRERGGGREESPSAEHSPGLEYLSFVTCGCNGQNLAVFS